MNTVVIDGKELFCTDDRNEWRDWLQENFETSKEIWFGFSTKGSI